MKGIRRDGRGAHCGQGANLAGVPIATAKPALPVPLPSTEQLLRSAGVHGLAPLWLRPVPRGDGPCDIMLCRPQPATCVRHIEVGRNEKGRRRMVHFTSALRLGALSLVLFPSVFPAVSQDNSPASKDADRKSTRLNS